MASRTKPFLLCLLLTTFLIPGPAEAGIGSYLADRARDLRDVFILEVGRGFWFAEMDVRVTDYATFCVGAAESRRWRLLGKWPMRPVEGAREGGTTGGLFPRRLEANVGFPSTTMLGFAYDHYPKSCGWISLPEFMDLSEDVDGWVESRLMIVDDWEHRKPWTQKFDGALGITLPFVAARVGASAGEFVDLFAGLVGLDPGRDDDRGDAD